MLNVNSLVFDVLPAQTDNIGGWQIDYSLLRAIADRLDQLADEHASIEAIESVLLIGMDLLIETYFPDGITKENTR